MLTLPITLSFKVFIIPRIAVPRRVSKNEYFDLDQNDGSEVTSMKDWVHRYFAMK